MKKLFKKLMIVVTVVSLFTIQFKVIHPLANMKNIPQNNFRAWPGRPGGNGDGSEEYMNGLKYGEMRGPWVYMYSSRGTTANLRRQSDTHSAIASAIVGLATTALTAGAGFWVSLSVSGLVGGIGIADAILNSKHYPGSTYSVSTYGSGRRLKLVYTFFDGDGYEITRETGYIYF